MEGFTEEVAVELGLKRWTEFTRLEESSENFSAPAINLATLSCEVEWMGALRLPGEWRDCYICL